MGIKLLAGTFPRLIPEVLKQLRELLRVLRPGPSWRSRSWTPTQPHQLQLQTLCCSHQTVKPVKCSFETCKTDSIGNMWTVPLREQLYESTVCLLCCSWNVSGESVCLGVLLVSSDKEKSVSYAASEPELKIGSVLLNTTHSLTPSFPVLHTISECVKDRRLSLCNNLCVRNTVWCHHVMMSWFTVRTCFHH